MARSFARHALKNISLLLLSFIFLPIDTAVVITSSLWGKVRPSSSFKSLKDDGDTRPDKKTILITGMSMSKGLALSRLFHRRGHRVIGADVHPLAVGRVSTSLDRFYVLPTVDGDASAQMEDEDDPYVLGLLNIVRKEAVDLWVSVSDVNNAMRDALAKDVIEAHTKAKAVQLGPGDVRSLHEKDAFMEHTQSLGLPVPESEVVSSRAAVIDFLHKRGRLELKSDKKQYILKPIGVDDVARNDAILIPAASERETLRRLDTVASFTTRSSTAIEKSFAATADEVDEKPAFLIQEFIRGREFCTHALIVKGMVRAFTACPSSGLLMHYTALPEEAPLCRSMLAFTRIMAAAGNNNWTGHISFDFIVKGHTSGDEDSSPSSSLCESPGTTKLNEASLGQEDVRIYPIECNPRVHTAVVLFHDTPRVVDEYLSILDTQEHNSSSSDSNEPIFPSTMLGQAPKQCYWIGQDLVERVVYPLFMYLFSSKVTWSQLTNSMWEFAWHLRDWRDGTFEVWDPWPWWWLYHVYWPARFLGFLVSGRRWSGINVSTGKAFMAR